MKDKSLETRQNEEGNERNVRKEHFHQLLYCWDTFTQILLSAWFYKTLQTQLGPSHLRKISCTSSNPTEQIKLQLKVVGLVFS